MFRGSNRSHRESTEAISLNALRGQAMNRLDSLQQKLESKGVNAAFTRSATKSDGMGDMGILGGLILNGILCAAFGAAVDSFQGMSGLSQHFAVAGCLEGASLLRDQNAEKYRSRKLNDYPEGRRQHAMKEGAATRQFNLVSANQNDRLSWDVQADMACMFEMIDLIDALEKEGAKTIRLKEKDVVYDVVKEASKSMFTKGAIRTFSRQMQMAV